MHSHSSSSAESSRSDSPDTRATTPSSHSDSDCLPVSHVYLSGTLPCPGGLKAIFSKHASFDRMGLIVEESDAPAFLGSAPDGQWAKHALNCSKAYYVSSTYRPAVSPSTNVLIPTDPVQASHQLLFSLSSLRAIISYPSHSLAPSADGSSGNIPTLDDWKTLWANWDLITLKMIPAEMLLQKPIDLRHKCLFYIGHIPTFLDMLICKAIGGEATDPKYFWNIFERGIDPHSHSEVPEKDEDWPTLEAIIDFRNGVRARLQNLYDDLASGKRQLTRNIARTLVMTHEHEGFHVETLLYMLIQKAGSGTLPPPGFITPPWEDLAAQWASILPPDTQSVLVGPASLTMGHDDSEGEDKLAHLAADVQGRTFGWDNESPRRVVSVGAFRAEWRPVTNGLVELPKSWVLEEDGSVKVRTMYGPVPMNVAEHWPVLTSYDDLASYAKFKGGRLPTEPELRLFLDIYDVGHEGGANVGFRNWHPTPATMGLDAYGGKGSNGGIWEWTSTVFDTHEGLVPTQLFTGYSADFFDTKHQVSLGASYATIPRLAGRRTVRNFYQHNYPYPWIGARVVYDA
ncbi:C-type lectin protein [Gymnopilus junonius]|uniref:C-type lectin protein n=1 Tax=Gymnopilus junonius TaxID=109634 RepID=A0A9P5TMM5_GYMJU|nr:C-type lectin protein [Gymnopilus junonius]